MRTAVKYLWPLFHAKFYGAESSGRSDWHRDKWVNLAVSMVHSSLTSILATIAVLSAWGEYADNENWIKPSQSSVPFFAMAISNGYCAYDTWDMLRIGMASQAMNLMVHHALLLAAFYLALELDIGIWFLTLSMLSEYNSVFLHLRVLLGMAGHNRNNSTVFRLTWWLLFLSMYTTRLPVLAYLLIRVVIGQDPWPNTAVWTLVLAILIGFNLLNFKLNLNVSKAYDKTRNSVISKRTQAIDALASWVWPLVSISAGVSLYFARRSGVMQES